MVGVGGIGCMLLALTYSHLPVTRSPCCACACFLLSALCSCAAEDVEGVKDLVDDYLDRNQDNFEEFGTPDDL